MLAILLACQSPAVDLEVEAEPVLEDTQAPSQVPGTFERGDCSEIYDPDTLPHFKVEITPQDWTALQADYSQGRKNYHPITLRWEDQDHPAQIRLKGNPNFSWLGEKMQFVISFNEEDPDARFMGLRKIALDAAWYEPTLLRDRLAMNLLRADDRLPAACVNNAKLSINGAYYGLYANIEYFDREWVERNFGDAAAAEGVLWKYGQEAKTNESQADRDLIDRYFSATSVARLEDLGDPEQWMREWAAEVVLGSDDGYWCCEHNFYLFEHPERDLVFVPWDLDITFNNLPYDNDPRTGAFQPPSQMLLLLRDEEWGPRFTDAVEEMSALLDQEKAEAWLEAWDTQILDAYEADPTRSVGIEEHHQDLEKLRQWIPARKAFLESWVACDRGETTDADGDGFAVCQDVDDGDPAVHPGATETCNGVDDDNNGQVDDHPDCDDCERHDFEDLHLLYCTAERSWDEALAECSDRGGTLATPTDTHGIYMTYLHTFNKAELWWLGATDAAQEGNWKDTSGTPTPGYWGNGEPDGTTSQNCAAWHTPSIRWRSEDCAQAHASICVLP